MSGFTGLVPLSLVPLLAALLLIAGFAALGSLFVYEVGKTNATRNFAAEMTQAVIAAFLLGFGLVFLGIASGVHL